MQPGRYYHIYLPSSHVGSLFSSLDQYTQFLRLYAELIQPIAQTYAYCLLPNHFHLLIKTRSIQERIRRWYDNHGAATAFDPLDADRQFALLFSQYAAFIACDTPLFGMPVERVEVRDEANLAALTRYIHHNPTLHGLVDNFREWRWSSYRAILSGGPTRISAETTLRWFYGEEWFDEMHWLPVDESTIGYLILKD